jgi:cell wall-associated NlpC family hydrolase
MPFQRLTIAAVTLTAVFLTNASAFASALSPHASVGCADEMIEALFAPNVADELGLTATVASIDAATTPVDPRQLLADFALKLRDIRYRRGGRAPSTGFDCSGFVHYVFAHALGIDLPDDSASQFRAGIKVARDDMKTGDLVFFHTRGKYVSHVGIYLGEGRFIHSPATGERVRVNRLDEQYWSHRFVGAKRPENLSS